MSYNNDMRNKAIKIWKYLSENPVSKSEAYWALDFKYDYMCCPACEVAGIIKNDRGVDTVNCAKCPMAGKWMTVDGYYVFRCEDEDAFYGLWSDSVEDEDLMEYASDVLENIKSEWKED